MAEGVGRIVPPNEIIRHDEPLNHALAEHDPVRIHGWAHNLIDQAEACLAPKPHVLKTLGKIASKALGSFAEAMVYASTPEAITLYQEEKRRQMKEDEV